MPPSSSCPSRRCRRSASGYGIVVGGVGGTGVVTIGALLGMAAHLEGKGAAVLDMTGLAQKGGAVMSHLRIAPRPGRHPDGAHRARRRPAAARLRSGRRRRQRGAGDARARSAAMRSSTRQPMMTGDFTRQADLDFPAAALRARDRRRRPARGRRFVDATRLAIALLGDAIATNLFMVGFAYQQGLLPVSAAAIERAIELNRVAVEMNRRAFRWGRRAALDPAAVEARGAAGRGPADRPAPGREPGRGDRAPGRVPDRLPGRRLRRALPRRWSSACARSRPRARRAAAS